MNAAGIGAGPRRGVALAVCAALVVLAALAWWLPANPEESEARLWRTYRITDVFAALAASGLAAAALYVVSSRDGAKRRIFRVALAALATGTCLLVLETPALLGHDYRRTFGTAPSDTWLQLAGGTNRTDPELIHLHRPHDAFTGEVSGNLAHLGIPGGRRHEVSVKYDRNGFRNDADLETAEVVVVGDSFVEAAIVPYEAIVTSRLRDRLRTTVANLGQEAYGLRQELAVLRRFGLPLRPRIAIWFVFGGNDLRDVDSHEAALRQLAAGPPRVPLRDRAFVGNALLALSRLTTPALTSPSDLALRHSALFTVEDGVRERIYFAEGVEPYDAHSWQVATEALAEGARLCREGDVCLLIAYIPRKFRVYRRHVEFAPESEAAQWVPSDLPDRLGRWSESAGIAFVDLSQALEREVAAGRQPYFADDVHWNARGHEVAAEEVAAALARLGWLDTKGSSR